MKKSMIVLAIAIPAALLPAGIGLAANPSLSAQVPVALAQVASGSGTPTASPTASPTATPISVPIDTTPIDDHGGDRPAGVSDDGPGHDLGDDKGGLRSSDDRSTSTAVATTDDHGSNSGHDGSGDDSSGSGSGKDDSGKSGKDDSGKSKSGKDDSGKSGSGQSGSGSSGSGKGGSDDGPNHDVNDDKGGDN